MRTRLLSEAMVKKRFPHLRYVRIHSRGRHTAIIYAWNEDLYLPEKDMRSLRQFGADYLNPQACFKVKAYDRVQVDEVPKVNGLPDLLVKTAMLRELNLDGILDFINALFSRGELSFNRYDAVEGTIHFDFRSGETVQPYEKQLMSQYLYEMMPIGSRSEVSYY